jgi:hypothetical protein
MTDQTIDTSADSAAVAPTPVVLTKAEKLAKIDKEIARLQQRRVDIENDVVTVKGAKVIVLPANGDIVTFQHGRLTATTQPVDLTGTVVAVKPVSVTEAGKKLPAQVKVQVGEGFDAEFYVIYPAQIKDAASNETEGEQAE